MPDAAYWRDYRARNAERIREYNRQRRQQPKIKAQRHASEERRRAKARLAEQSAPMAAMPTGHSLYSQAQELLGSTRSSGRALKWQSELDHEDATQIAVLALLEGGDPSPAVKAFRSAQRAWMLSTTQIPEGWN